VAKTHRNPGRAASGGALAPEPAARHRGRMRGPTDFSGLFLPSFSHFFEIGRLHDRTSIFNVRFEIGRSVSLFGRRRIWDERCKQEDERCKQEGGGKGRMCNSTSSADIPFDIARLTPPISRGKWKSDISLDAPSTGALVRPLWRAAAPWLKPLRLPRTQLQVIFHKRATNCRAFLRKMTHKDKAFYGSWAPCRGWRVILLIFINYIGVSCS